MSRYFTELNYSLGDEDSAVEHHLAQPGLRRVAAVAGSGGRALPLLAKRPDRLVCFDTLEIQLHLTRLRVETARALGLEDFAAFWGYPPTPMSVAERKDCFQGLTLPANTAASLAALFERHQWGELIYIGRFERMFKTLASINYLCTGQAGRGLFERQTIEAQAAYLETQFPDRRWRLVIAMLANSALLNTILYRGDFPKKNVPGSTYANFRAIYDRLFRNVRVRESFFAQLSFFGRLVTREAGLMEVDPSIFGLIKEALQHTEVEYVHGDIVQGVANSADPYDFVSISDVPSFLPPAIAADYLKDIRPGLGSGAVVVARGNLRVVTPDTTGFDDISRDLARPCKEEKTQLWRINAYRRQ